MYYGTITGLTEPGSRNKCEMKRKIFAICLVALAFGACNDENNGPEGNGNGGPNNGGNTETTKAIRQITYEETLNYRLYGSEESVDKDNFTKTLSYDEQGRVARIVTRYPNHVANWEESSRTLTADYNIVEEITIKELSDYPESTEPADDEYTVRLSGNKASSVVFYDDYLGEFVDCVRYKHTTDGYLEREERTEDRATSEFLYEDGVWTKYKYTDEYNRETETYDLDPAKYYPTRLPNNGQIDITALLGMCGEDETETLFYLGRLGHVGKYLPEILPSTEEMPEMVGNEDRYTTPGEIIHKTRGYVEYPENAEIPISYKFDKDNCLTQISYTETFTGVQVGYDIVVGNELIDPNNPWRGYEYTVQNRTEKKTTDKNIRTWKISY